MRKQGRSLLLLIAVMLLLLASCSESEDDRINWDECKRQMPEYMEQMREIWREWTDTTYDVMAPG